MNLSRIIVLCFIVLCTSCSSSALQMLESNAHAQSRGSSYSPLDPAISTLPLAAALRGANYKHLGTYSVTALTVGNQPDPTTLAAIKLTESDDALVVHCTRPLHAAGLYVRYDASTQRFLEAELVESGAIGMSIIAEPGLLAIGVAATGNGMLATTIPLARLCFANEPETAIRQISAISQDQRTAVRDLAVAYEGGQFATLTWLERHTGDYNLDGLVTVIDITPVAQNFNELVEEGTPDWAQREVINGNEDGMINISDLTEIAQNWNSYLAGYNVYRIELANPEDEPAYDDPGWEKVLNDAEPIGPSASRVGMYNGQITRIPWTFQDEPELVTNYGWYVAPVGSPSEDSTWRDSIGR